MGAKRPGRLDLKVDYKDEALSRPINEFLAELKSSSSVVFLLNDAYFWSPWCLGELHAFIEKRHSGFHGFFIACEGWLPETDTREFFAKLEQSLIIHWQQVG